MSFRKPTSPRFNPRKRPLKLGRSTNVLWTILPTILIVAALFIGFSYINMFVRNFLSKEEVTVRNLDGVEVLKGPVPVLEQEPPPSPEEVVEAYYQEIEDRKERVRPAPLEPVLETEVAPEVKVELQPVDVPPIEVPGLVENRSGEDS